MDEKATGIRDEFKQYITEAVNNAYGFYCSGYNDRQPEIDRLRSENEKLREAAKVVLEAVVKLTDGLVHDDLDKKAFSKSTYRAFSDVMNSTKSLGDVVYDRD